MWITYIQNTKSPLLDGLNVATLPKSGVSQDKLAKPIRNAGCQLDSSIENHQKLVNSKRNKVNSGRKDMRRLLSLKNDTELKKLKSSVKKT